MSWYFFLRIIKTYIEILNANAITNEIANLNSKFIHDSLTSLLNIVLLLNAILFSKLKPLKSIDLSIDLLTLF